MTADHDNLDLFLVKTLELLGDVCAGRIARKYSVIEVATDQE